MLLGKSRGQLLISPETMKQLGQSINDAQLWMCLMVKVKSGAVKKNIYIIIYYCNYIIIYNYIIFI